MSLLLAKLNVVVAAVAVGKLPMGPREELAIDVQKLQR